MGQSGAGDRNFCSLGDSSDTKGTEFGKNWDNMGRDEKNSAHSSQGDTAFPSAGPPQVLPLSGWLCSIPHSATESGQPIAMALFTAPRQV